LRKPRIYIAGPYNGDNVIEVIENIHHGLLLNAKVKLLGFYTYCPWDDFLQALFLPGISAEEWKDEAMEELLRSDAIVIGDLHPRWQDSGGTIDELATSFYNGIPIFMESKLAELMLWKWGKEVEAGRAPYSPYDQEDDGGA